jgi:hypothetical protein
MPTRGFGSCLTLRVPAKSENDVEVEDWRRHQLTRLFELLATHTASPEECYFCVWDGYGGADEAVDDGAVYIDDEDEVAQFGRLDARPGAAPPSCCIHDDFECADGRD